MDEWVSGLAQSFSKTSSLGSSCNRCRCGLTKCLHGAPSQEVNRQRIPAWKTGFFLSQSPQSLPPQPSVGFKRRWAQSLGSERGISFVSTSFKNMINNSPQSALSAQTPSTWVSQVWLVTKGSWMKKAPSPFTSISLWTAVKKKVHLSYTHINRPLTRRENTNTPLQMYFWPSLGVGRGRSPKGALLTPTTRCHSGWREKSLGDPRRDMQSLRMKEGGCMDGSPPNGLGLSSSVQTNRQWLCPRHCSVCWEREIWRQKHSVIPAHKELTF